MVFKLMASLFLVAISGGMAAGVAALVLTEPMPLGAKILLATVAFAACGFIGRCGAFLWSED